MSEETASGKRIFMKDLYPWQRKVWNQFLQQFDQNRFSHAQLLHGQPHTDLEAFTLLFARYLLCKSPRGHLPCGECRDCQLMEAGSHPEFQEITFSFNDEGKIRSVIVIDQIRQMIEKVQMSSFQGRCKVVMIHPAEDLMPAATNALLKILEEPPANTYFLLVSYNPGRLISTIRSRCQRVEVPLPDLVEGMSWLSQHIADARQREELLAISGGNPVLVRYWMDAGLVPEILATPQELSQLLQGTQSPLVLAKQWQKGESEQPSLDRVLWWWRWLLFSLKEQAMHAPIDRFSLSRSQLIDFMQRLLVARRQLESTANPNEELLLESLLIEWQNLRP